jgi:hypothetical protein
LARKWFECFRPYSRDGAISFTTSQPGRANYRLHENLGAALYYGGVPGAAAKASLKGAGHNDLQAAAGYVTAWLDYTLKGDGYARGAFVGDPPEIVERSGDPEDAWENVALKNLP